MAPQSTESLDVAKPPAKNMNFIESFTHNVRSIWATRQTEETKGNIDLTIKTTLRELVVYILFIITLCIMSFGTTNSSTYNLNKIMHTIFVETPADPSNPNSNFLNLNLPEDYFDFLEKVLVPNLYSKWDNYHGDAGLYREGRGFILYENVLQGVPRIRQVRVMKDSCPVPEDFKSQIKACYSSYSEKSKETSPYGNINGTAWRYSSEEEIDGASVKGEVGSYDGGGYYTNLAASANESLQQIEELKQNLWIDRATRAVFVDFTIYNANMNYFCIIKLIAEFPPTGGIIPSVVFRPVKLIRYTSTSDYIVMATEVLFCLFIIYYIVEEILEIKKNGCEYFKEFWNIIDIIVIVISICVIAFNIYSFLEVKKLLVTILENPDTYLDFDFISYWLVVFNAGISIMCFLAWVKIFKYVSFNKTMTQLSSTLGASSKDLTGFAIMFFIIFLAFAQLGYIMFGTQARDFSTYSSAIFTLFRLILGDFDFQALQKANRVLGPAYFILYVFFVFFVLLNMFIAIINDTYAVVKAELAETKNEIEFSEFLKKRANNMMEKMNSKKKSHDTKKELELGVPGSSADMLEGDSDSLKSGNKEEGKKDEEGYESGEEGDEGKGELSVMRERVKRMECSMGTLLFKIDSFLVDLEAIERSKERRMVNLGRLIDQISEQPDGEDGKEVLEKEMEKGVKEEYDRWKRESFTQPEPTLF